MQTKSIDNNNGIGLSALVFAVYVALTPVHQALLLSGGNTLNKYLAYLLIAAICIRLFMIKQSFNVELILKMLPFTLWIGFSIIWSPVHSFSNLSTTLGHIMLVVFCCSVLWNEKEIGLIRKALIFSSVYFSVMLILSQISGEVKRSSITFNINNKTTDQNVLAANIGIGLLLALSYYIHSSNLIWKWISFASVFIIVLGILSTGSRGALIAVVIAVLYLLMVSSKSKRMRIGAMIGIIVGVVFLILYVFYGGHLLGDFVLNRYTNAEELEGGAGRWDIWCDYFEILIHKPEVLMFGYGYPQSGAVYTEYFHNRYPPSTHNDYLFILCSCGAIGLTFAGHFVKYIWQTGKSKKNSTGLACMLLALVMSVTLNFFVTYGWWNALIFAYIGEIGIVSEEGNEN